jgi:hypothetical protein
MDKLLGLVGLEAVISQAAILTAAPVIVCKRE